MVVVCYSLTVRYHPLNDEPSDEKNRIASPHERAEFMEPILRNMGKAVEVRKPCRTDKRSDHIRQAWRGESFTNNRIINMHCLYTAIPYFLTTICILARTRACGALDISFFPTYKNPCLRKNEGEVLYIAKTNINGSLDIEQRGITAFSFFSFLFFAHFAYLSLWFWGLGSLF